MRIPLDAKIDHRKLYDYLLQPLIRNDKSTFLGYAGFNRGNATLLRQAILALSTSVDAVECETTEYGTKWRVSGTIEGPNGRKLMVRLIWIHRFDDDLFHFVTLVPNAGGSP